MLKTKHRVRIVIRNIGLELPGSAIGILTIDFGDAEHFTAALKKLETGLTGALPPAIILENDRGEMLGFNPHHYSYHTVPKQDFGTWQSVGCVWELPPKSPRRRKS